MADWFDFKGTRSTSLGVTMQTPPPVTLAEERAKFETIPGRSGSLTLLEGDAVYEDIVLSVECYVRDLSALDQIAAWLRGSGDLVLGNQPTRYYKARCVNQIELAKVLRGRGHRTFAAVFRCAPYRYVYPAPTALTYLPLVNRVTNGNFVNTTGWAPTASTQAAAGNVLTNTGDGSSAAAYSKQAGAFSGSTNKFYYRARCRVTNSACTRIDVGNGTFTGGYAGVSSPVINQWYNISGVGSGTNDGALYLVHRYANAAAASGKAMEIKEALCIDLTATFGAGNEPTAAQMDAYTADRYAASWFNGTASGGQIVNPATADALPLITVVGSGDITLNIGGRTIFISGLATSITIDTETGMAYNGSTDLTSKVTLDYYPWVIPPGTSAISWTGTVTSVTITAPWRYI